ncbi:MAG: GyrI-like domain-containing protein [Micromonosporaceae bacterium]
MTAPPRVVERAAQPYVAIAGVVTRDTFSQIADRLPELIGWLAERGIAPAAAPFLRYHVIDMPHRLEIEAGVPVPSQVTGEGLIRYGVLPAGRYATVTHVGHPERLTDLTAALLRWGAEQGWRWDMTETEAGERWGCRLEVYETDPRTHPDPATWQTTLAFRLAD